MDRFDASHAADRQHICCKLASTHGPAFHMPGRSRSHPVAIQRAVAVSRALVADVRAELVQLDATVIQQQARLNELQVAYGRLNKLLPDTATARRPC